MFVAQPRRGMRSAFSQGVQSFACAVARKLGSFSRNREEAFPNSLQADFVSDWPG